MNGDFNGFYRITNYEQKHLLLAKYSSFKHIKYFYEHRKMFFCFWANILMEFNELFRTYDKNIFRICPIYFNDKHKVIP